MSYKPHWISSEVVTLTYLVPLATFAWSYIGYLTNSWVPVVFLLFNVIGILILFIVTSEEENSHGKS